MEEFTLINKQRNRIKVFKPFEDISKPSPSINAMEISYGCVYKRSSKPVMKGSRVETIEDARKEYKQLLEEGWKKTSIFKSYFYKFFNSCSIFSSLSFNSFFSLIKDFFFSARSLFKGELKYFW